MSSHSPDALITQFRELVDRLLFLEKQGFTGPEGTKLYPSEIHLMAAVGEDPSTNATRIAVRMGITKGAVSQTIARLERKGILVKARDRSNKNALVLRFTEKGLRIVQVYEERKESLFRPWVRSLGGLAENERKAISGFLFQAETLIKGM